MSQESLKINIAHLYPKLLNLYGDLGNLLALKRRCEDRNIQCDITTIDIGDDISFDNFDIFFLGGGQDKQQLTVLNELLTHKDNLLHAANNGKVFLAICGGYQMLGKYFLSKNSQKIDCLGLLDVYTKDCNQRFTGNVTAEVDFLEPKTLVGFENHSGLTFLENDTKPISKIVVGNGNNGVDKTEGARKNNVLGTYMHGSILPKNPHFTDYLIKTALEVKYNENINLVSLDDSLEMLAHNDLVNKKY